MTNFDMTEEEVSKILLRDKVKIDRDVDAEDAGKKWALNYASYSELWALEQIIHRLHDEDHEISLSERIAKCLGRGPDVFWFLVRGKECRDVSHQEALEQIPFSWHSRNF